MASYPINQNKKQQQQRYKWQERKRARSPLYERSIGYPECNARLCEIIGEIARGLAQFSTDRDTLGDAYEYLIGQFASGSGKKAGEFYTPQQISGILPAIVTLDSVLDFACGSGSLLLNVRHCMGPDGIGKIYGQEKNITTYNLARMNI